MNGVGKGASLGPAPLRRLGAGLVRRLGAGGAVSGPSRGRNVIAEGLGPRRPEPAWGGRLSAACAPVSLAVAAPSRRVLTRGAA